MAKELGISAQTLRNFVKQIAAARGALAGSATKAVTEEQIDSHGCGRKTPSAQAGERNHKKQRRTSRKMFCDTPGLISIDGNTVFGRDVRRIGGQYEVAADPGNGARHLVQRLTDTWVLALIKAIHAELREPMAAARMLRELRSRGDPGQ